MAKYVLEDAFLSIGGVTMSDHTVNITIASSMAELASAAMGDTWEEFTGGLLSWVMSADLHQDHAASNVDATLWAIMIARVATAIIIRPDSAAVGATNPEWTGNALLTTYSPLDGSHGGLAMTKPAFKGTGALARAVA